MKITPRPDNHKRHADVDTKKMGIRDKTLWSYLRQVIAMYGKPDELSDSEKANFDETLQRAFKAWKENYILDELTEEEFQESLTRLVADMEALINPKNSIKTALTEILETGFPLEAGSTDCGIITQGPIEAEGLCPHHLLPVSYDIFVAYKPKVGAPVLGLSKLARTAKLLAARPVLQEQVAQDIADAFFFAENTNDRKDLPQIETAGSAVQVIGCHSCMCSRGVKSLALTLSTVLRGQFQTDSLKEEFYQAIGAIQRSELASSYTAEDEEEEFGVPAEGEDEDEEGDDEDGDE